MLPTLKREIKKKSILRNIHSQTRHVQREQYKRCESSIIIWQLKKILNKIMPLNKSAIQHITQKLTCQKFEDVTINSHFKIKQNKFKLA